ncbi:MAG: hypothetical protein JZU65_11360 [Chlorobium sp.]|nr:hypothetical protein [Chlorobium sp.]
MGIDDELTMSVAAYHEAGHAVVAIIKSMPIWSISILPCDNYKGSCEIDAYRYARNNMDKLRDVNIDVIEFLKAGKIVENKYISDVLLDEDVKILFKNSANDDEQKIEARCNNNDSNKYEPIDLHEVCNNVSMLIDKPEVWAVIQHVADILMVEKKLEGDILDRYLRKFYSNAQSVNF